MELSFGEELSTVAAAQDSAVRHEVEDRAWQRSAIDDEEAVERRASTLRQRLDRVEDRLEEIRMMEERGEVDERRARALEAHARSRAVGVERSAERMVEHGEDRGADTSEVQELRERARETRDFGVSEAARGIAGPPEDASQPEHAGPEGERGGDETGEVTPSTERGEAGDDHRTDQGSGDRGDGRPVGSSEAEESGGDGGSGAADADFVRDTPPSDDRSRDRGSGASDEGPGPSGDRGSGGSDGGGGGSDGGGGGPR